MFWMMSRVSGSIEIGPRGLSHAIPFIASNGSGVADDVDGDPVFLAKNEFYLGYTKERAEGIEFASVKDVKKKA